MSEVGYAINGDNEFLSKFRNQFHGIRDRELMFPNSLSHPKANSKEHVAFKKLVEASNG